MPLKRIVKLTIDPNRINEFESFFLEYFNDICRVEGVEFASFYNEGRKNHIYFTITDWKSEYYLELYRHSDLFKEIWSKVKPLFIEKAEAWSLKPLKN